MSHPQTTQLRFAVRTSAALTVATLALGLMAVLAPRPAHALSCMPFPNLTADEFVSGDVNANTTDQWLTREELQSAAGRDMLIGLVTRMDELTYDNRPTTMDVTVYRHRGPAVDRFTTVQIDSTWGPTLQPGVTWLFPYDLADGQVRLNLCEPTLIIQDDDLDRVLRLADENGWTIPGDDDPSPAGPSDPSDSPSTTSGATFEPAPESARPPATVTSVDGNAAGTPWLIRLMLSGFAIFMVLTG